MNWDRIEGSWMKIKGKVRERWGKLTDDDVDVIAGKRDQLVGTLQQKYGNTKEAVEQEIDAWTKAVDADFDKGAHAAAEARTH